jgi:hypothetical protein
MLTVRLGVVVVRTVALMVVRRVLGVFGCGPTPDANEVEIAVLRHQLAGPCRARGLTMTEHGLIGTTERRLDQLTVTRRSARSTFD